MAVLGGQGTLRNLETEEKLEISWFQAGEETVMTEMKTCACSWLKNLISKQYLRNTERFRFISRIHSDKKTCKSLKKTPVKV